ncbi:hypothetical protein [Tautonia sociabilis]|jgi:hypothetical protein|uniref:Uncharacterized protein n=1 Tax=Tautonia sociabilis TaxID=2080755 RepID=A0A432ME91_9BACT|nr:hypothetical protein [Tautonia sociabilis]RUL83567.1 hypothetical protein TsocGM_21930 [Tautonia sociabilis]
MKRAKRRIAASALALIAAGLAQRPAEARAQAAGMGRSLGGYGEATIERYYRSGQGPLIPYGGGQGGFIPYRGLEAREPAAAAMIPRRIEQTPIGGAGAMGTPIGGASLMRGTFTYRPLTSRGLTGMGPAVGPGMTGGGRRMGLGFGYPFRQPPSLSGRGGGAAMGGM